MKKISLLSLLLLFPTLSFATTYTVTTADDEYDGLVCSVGDTDCSLREALARASATAGTDTITFDSTLSGTTICLSSALGMLNVTSDVIIEGLGESETVIDGGDTTAGGTTTCTSSAGSGIFYVSTAKNLQISNITVKGGTAASGGAFNVRRSGILTVIDSTISGNASTNYGGGIYGDTSTTINISGSTFDTNLATQNGGAIHATSSSNLSISDSVFSNNSAPGNGGAIYSSSSNTVIVGQSTFSGNSSNQNGGAIYTDSIDIQKSIFSDNSTMIYGGAIAATSLTMSQSTLTDNIARFGGGLFSGTISIENSTFNGNIGDFGGAINSESDMAIFNSTFTENIANYGGAIGVGGGSYDITIDNSTLSGNEANSHGGGIYINTLADVKIRNTILAGNTSPLSTEADCYVAISGLLSSNDYNFIPSSGCNYSPQANDITDGLNLELETLASNGGETDTMALLSTSAAIDTGYCENIAGATVSEDQRSQSRDSLCDIGAFEYVLETCGDNVVTINEQCDDNNTTSGDGCSDLCITEYCGDNITNNSTESCDDGNLTSGDGCSDSCALEYCGDNIINNSSEQCDDSNTTSGDGCSDLCITEYCGDGIINNATETCDNGAAVTGDHCSDACLIENVSPASNAGVDKRIVYRVGRTVNLNGSLSSDPDGDPLTYQWSVVSVPVGSAVTTASITSPTSSTTNFRPDRRGRYEFQLTVTDSYGASASDNLVIQMTR